MKTFIRAILAGIAVTMGGIVYLTLENHIVGAFLFTIGLFSIYTFGLDLFTGKICFIPNMELKFLKTVGIVYLGNLVGTVGMGYIFRNTKMQKLVPYTVEMVEKKMSDTMFSIFIMAIMCGMLMSIAVIGYKTLSDGIGKYFGLALPVMVFILSGYEHSVADMFYLAMANEWTGKSILFLLVVSLGNLVGGMILPFFARVLDGKKLGLDH